MASINLDLQYFDHPKTGRLIRLLGRGSEVLPVRLWCYCGRHFSETGRLAGISAQEIETAVAWWGPTGKAVDALVECGFLELDGDAYVVHDWLDHSGHLRVYKERAKKAAFHRWGKVGADPPDASSNASSNASSIPSLSNGSKGKTEPRKKPKPRALEEVGVQGEGKPPRPRDLLFDAVAEVTGSDPKTAGGYVGSTCAELRKAEPPYTPEEIMAFPGIIFRELPWAKDRKPTLNEVLKYIGRVRAKVGFTGLTNKRRESYRKEEAARVEEARKADPAGVRAALDAAKEQGKL